ncbi:hypothetical protein TNCV_1387921 [Trichonephila clavipes]|nr:hypothetical protein TNCV_1387921 [Trichonephila clavipes]
MSESEKRAKNRSDLHTDRGTSSAKRQEKHNSSPKRAGEKRSSARKGRSGLNRVHRERKSFFHLPEGGKRWGRLGETLHFLFKMWLFVFSPSYEASEESFRFQSKLRGRVCCTAGGPVSSCDWVAGLKSDRSIVMRWKLIVERQ